MLHHSSSALEDNLAAMTDQMLFRAVVLLVVEGPR